MYYSKPSYSRSVLLAEGSSAARKWWIVGGGLALLVAGGAVTAMVQEDPDLQRYANYAQIIGVVLTVLGALFVWTRARAARAAGVVEDVEPAVVLARRVWRAETDTRFALLGDTAFADLSFCPPSGGPVPTLRRRVFELLRFTGNRGAGGDLSTVADFYRHHLRADSGRLLVLGSPGAGKSVLAIQVVLDLLAQCVALGRGDLLYVPVRISLAGWDGQAPFEQWLAAHLTLDHGVPPVAAADLVERRVVLPVLDGLDEMDLDLAAVGPQARAVEAVRQLNDYVDGPARAPIVVTCRQDRHDQLIALGAVLRDATTITIQPLTVDRLDAYFVDRLADQPALLRRWRTAFADGGRGGRILRQVLSTPWRLFLAITLTESGRAPADLVRHLRDETDLGAQQMLVEELLSGFVAATIRLAEGRRRYQPAKVATWLRSIGSSLGAGNERRSPKYSAFGVSGSEMVPHLMWFAAGRKQVAALHAALTTVAALIFGYALYLIVVPKPATPITNGMFLLFGAIDMVTLLMIRGFANLKSVSNQLHIAELKVRLGRYSAPGAAEWHRELVRNFSPVLRWFPSTSPPRSPVAALAGCCAVLPLALLFLTTQLQNSNGATLKAALLSTSQAVFFAAAMFCLVGLLAGTTTWEHNPFPGFENPRLVSSQAALRADLRSGVGFGVGVGVASATAAVVAGARVTPVTCGLLFLASIVLGVAMVARMSTRYALGRLVGALTGRLPWRLGAFLDWACRAGLLRRAGIAYQFRHLEFQEWVMQERPLPMLGTHDKVTG